ncbi:unnamed protein product [Mytilus edulis]|uniref:Apple domain-containing protein n=1 Tax=Mytilus edulis TaxID=6550 RepID=A0A8S3PVZ7_MYTED|nr:unnamed protein product [Mytilus edulis]
MGITHSGCHRQQNFAQKTINANEPSWWADLGAIYEISNVVIFGRTDCCDERLSDFSIEVITPCRNNTDWFEDSRIEVCYYQQEPTKWLNATCHKRMIGQYVRIRLSNPKQLALCEVEVHGTFVGFLHTVNFPYACGFGGHSYDGHNEILGSANVYSDIHCTYICTYTKECHVADFNKKTSVCTLMKKKTGSNVVLLILTTTFFSFIKHEADTCDAFLQFCKLKLAINT